MTLLPEALPAGVGPKANLADLGPLEPGPHPAGPRLFLPPAETAAAGKVLE